MPTLQEMLLGPDDLANVVADVQALVDSELASKGGLSGAALKTAYKAVTSFAPGYYHETVTVMVPEMAGRLEPYWADFLASGGADFGDYLAKRGDEVSESLLGITDDMMRRSNRAAVVKAYQLVRGGAGKNIEAALPGLGAVVQKYA
jgi:Family of unknown function (DUF6918)